MKPIVSIIIPSFNTKELTLACLKSIKENVSLRYEVIAVDNASTDGSSELAVIKNRQNLGFSKAVNQGIKAARGKYILLLNSDTQVKSGAIDKLVEFAKKTPDAGVIGPRLLNEDGSIQESYKYLSTVKSTILQYWFGKKLIVTGSVPVKVDAVVGAAFLITPRALKKVGLFDERYFMYFEDLDYCRRVKRASLKVYYLPIAEIIHYHGASGKDLADPALQWKRLIPSSKIYHGTLGHYLIIFIIWLSQKLRKSI